MRQDILDSKETLRVFPAAILYRGFAKTLRVSPTNCHRTERVDLVNLGDDQSRKPLGSHYVSDQFSNFFNAYAKTINKAYGRTGSLFQHPFGRVPITNDRQFWNAIAYIHQNPQKHRFVKDFRDWKYSSYGVILGKKPTVVKHNEVMKWFGTREDYLSLHDQWVTDAQAKWFMDSDFD